MSHTSDALYKALQAKEPTRYEMLEYCWALKELAEGTSGNNLWEVLRHVNQAERYLAEFRGKMIPTPDLINKEINLAYGLHTYMRKGMDCPLGTMLHRMISDNKGLPVWFAFVKALVANYTAKSSPSRLYHLALRAAEDTYHLGQETYDNLMMLMALKMWEDDFDNAMEWMKGDDTEGEAGTA